MKKTKIPLICLIVLAMLLTAVACKQTETVATTQPTQAAATPTPKTDPTAEPTPVPYSEQETLQVSFMMGPKELLPDNYLKDLLLEKYNIELSFFGAYTQAITEVPLLMASDTYPEWIYSDSYVAYTDLAYDGYFINWDEYMDKLPNYRALYTDQQWEQDLATRRYDDGGLYFLPQYRVWLISRGLLVRQDLLDANNLKPPTTADEIMQLCEDWKEIYPDSLPIADKWEMCFQALRYVFGAYPGVDVITGEYDPYYYISDEMRDTHIFFHELYTRGYIDPEFITVSNAQFEERFATSNPCMVFGSITWEENLNTWTKAGTGDLNQNPNWRAVEAVISNNPEVKIYERNITAQNWGCFFTDKMLEQEGLLDRMLDFINWTCSEEGQIWQTFGVEDESFNYDAQGAPQYIEAVVDPFGARKDGKPTREEIGLISPTCWNTETINAIYGNDAWLRVQNAVVNDPNAYGIVPKLALKVPEDKVDRKAELESLISTVFGEYYNKLRTAVLDPSNDDHWNEYIQALNAAGLEEYRALMIELYNAQYGE